MPIKYVLQQNKPAGSLLDWIILIIGISYTFFKKKVVYIVAHSKSTYVL
jgi:putative AlgH/UPF0301 family transcriptional regulator